MALGAVTQNPVDPHSNVQAIPVAVGDVKMAVINVVGEASYTTGGPVITAQQFGFVNAILGGQAEVYASTGSNGTSTAMSVVIQAGFGSAKLQCWTNGNVEIGSAVNVSGVTWQIIAFGY
jgi:hypothetical protein